MRKSASESDAWVELPTGIFTADGVWYHTTEEALREYADAVVERVGVAALLSRAGSWFRSADAISTTALAVLLLMMPPMPAVLATLVLYLLWDLYSPQFVFIPLVRLLSVLSLAGVQGVLYVLIVSWLGAGGQVISATVGLVGFILFRWGLIRKALSPVSDKLAGSHNSLPKQDRILRTLILRYAISMRLTLPSTAAYENRIFEIWQRGKRK